MNASGSLTHALQAKVTIPASRRRNRIHSAAVIANSHRKVLGITQLHFDARSTGMHECVANGFATNGTNLIGYDRIHFDGRAADVHNPIQNAVRFTLVQRGLQSLGQLAIIEGSGVKRVESSPALAHSPVNPFGKFFYRAARIFHVRAMFERIIGNQFTALQRLQKRIVQLARQTRALADTFFQTKFNDTSRYGPANLGCPGSG